MDPQAVLDTALAANAAALGNGLATEYFREAVKGSYKVTFNLRAPEREYLRRLVPFPLIFTNSRPIASDHSVIASCRELARDVYEKCFSVSRTTERTLVVGAAMREISKYEVNPNVHFYVHGGEAKDVDRIVRPALLAIADRLRKKAAKSDRRVYQPHAKDQHKAPQRPAAKRYTHMQQVLRDYVEASQLPDNIHTEPVQANTLVFEDSIYNFDAASLTKLFNDTGASVGYGYAFLPMELLFPDMPANRLYMYVREGEHARVTFRGGTSNGYRHLHRTWAMLYQNPVIVHWGTYLAVEIVCRIGPMCVFKIMRANQPETVVRSIALTEQETFVRLLDMPAMYDHELQTLRTPLTYISVREDEFLDAVNYLLALDEKSRTLTNVLSYVRRRMGGMSLVARELVAPWDLPKRHVLPFALAVTAWVSMQVGTVFQFADPENFAFATWWDSIKSRLCSWFRLSLKDRFEVLYGLLYKYRIEEELVLTPDNERIQYGEIRARLVRMAKPSTADDDTPFMDVPRGTVAAGLYLDFENEEDLPSCEVCLALMGKLGAQRVVCGAKEDSYFTFSLTEGELGNLRTGLMDTDNDPGPLAAVKKRALEAMPKQPFTHTARVRYLRAGPGCGKSYIIRQLADENDLVVAPFAKLKADYENLQNANGVRYNLDFKTTHRALETRGKARIFVDEFTSLSYDVLACVAFNNAATDIILVGDDKQTCVQEPNEGIYIGNRINLAGLDVHDLVVNFRNPPDTVALLNKCFGYKMVPAKAYTEPSVVFTTRDDPDLPATALAMCFTKAEALRVTEDVKNTVRSNQGGTYPVVVLHVNSADGSTPEVESLQVVAMSRHSEKLYVVCDDSAAANKFRSRFDFGPAWETEHAEHVKFAEVVVNKPDHSDEVIARVLRGAEDSDPARTSDDSGSSSTDLDSEEEPDMVRSVGADQEARQRRSREREIAAELASQGRGRDDRAKKCQVELARTLARLNGSKILEASDSDDAGAVAMCDRRRAWDMLRLAGLEALRGSRAATPGTVTPEGAVSTSGIGSMAGSSEELDGDEAPVPAEQITLSDVDVAVVAVERELDDLAAIVDAAAPAVGPPCVGSATAVAVPSREEEETRAGGSDSAVESDGDLDVRVAVANVAAEAVAGCMCGRLRDVGLTDGCRTHPPDTRQKINQLLGFVNARLGETASTACILGGAASEGARTARMATPSFVDVHPDWWSVDPRFAARGHARCMRGNFLDASSAGTHVYYSDMWTEETGGNNMLEAVLAWYKEGNPKETWGKFALAHKLTWSTTGVAGLQRALQQAARFWVLRTIASGASSEYWIVIAGLRTEGAADIRCCEIARRINDLYAHVETCEDCLNGRLVDGGICGWHQLGQWRDVLTNCRRQNGNPLSAYKSALSNYLSRGVLPPGAQSAHLKGTGERRQREDFWKAWPILRRAGGGGGSMSGAAHGAPVWTLTEKEGLEGRLHSEDTVTHARLEAREYLDAAADFSEHAQTWMHHPRIGVRDYDRLPAVMPVKQPLPQTPRDPHLCAGELLGSMATSDQTTSWNWYQSQVVRGQFRTGKMDLDQVIMPVNGRKHPMSLTEKYFSAGPGMGLHFSAKKPCQTLAVMETRYLNARKNFPFGNSEMLLAREIVDLWFGEHVRPAHERPELFTDDDIDKAMDAFLTDAKSKGYASRYEGTMRDEGPEGRIVRFHLKTIFKPKLKPDLAKVGQGISAWSVQALAMYCSVFRLLTTVSLKLEKDYVITDAYWAETKFVDYVNKMLGTVPSVARFGVTDGEMFDACQNEFTQELERHYLRRMGLSEEIIAHYYSFRKAYYLKASCVEGRAGTQKTSGEPGTLFNNGVVARMISNWLLRGDGPCVIIYKGDDFVKRQCNLAVDEQRRKKLDTVCALRIRVNISDGAEFCGLVLEDGFMFPSIVRKLNKAVSHRYRTYKHFCEYQTALRDWTAAVNHYGLEKVIGYNATMYSTSYAQMEAIFYAVQGLSHINERQFYGMFLGCVEPATVPVMSWDTGRTVMVEV